jgi:hypothetical protein
MKRRSSPTPDALGAPRVICCRGEGRCLLVEGDTRRELGYTAIEEAMDTWNR